MSHPKVTFQVRRRSSESLTALGERVGGALGCTFGPADDPRFDMGEALATSCLGLHITLNYDPMISEGNLRTYILLGSLRSDIGAEWELDPPRISISEFILGVLTIVDGPGWYIPTRREKYEEAGLEPPPDAGSR
jgi:hypothetical protein